MSDQPFQFTRYGDTYVLLIDGTLLDHPEPIWVNLDGRPVQADEILVRLQLNEEEYSQLETVLERGRA